MGKEQIGEFIAKYGIRMEADFVPWSQSRNRPDPSSKDPERKKGWKSLNWNVRLYMRHGTDIKRERLIHSTEYSAGISHTPAYQRFARGKLTERHAAVMEAEIEKGCECAPPYEGWGEVRFVFRGGKRVLLLPDLRSVLSSVALDCDVLNYQSFADWAPDLGYDADSIKGKNVYDHCLERAVALQAMIGSAVLDELRQAAQDY